jgi:hypothetical protein
MKRRSRDEEREQRITMEIIVDAYTPEEQAMGWYYSLEDRLTVPFVARCIAERSISPLRVGDEVEVVGMAPEAECQHEMFVLRGPRATSLITGMAMRRRGGQCSSTLHASRGGAAALRPGPGRGS